MTSDSHPDDLLGAYVLGAGTGGEAAVVAEHLGRCPECAAEAARLRAGAEWVGEIIERRPPRELRSRVLAAARSAREPSGVEVGELLAPYLSQVAALDRLLDDLAPPDWGRPVGPHATVRELVGHLAANDARVSEPVQSTVDVKRAWRAQADVLVRRVAEDGPRRLDRLVPLAGRGAIVRPLREALTQRAFETWIHAEDLRRLLARPPEEPSDRLVTRIADFGLRLLPGALDAAGRGRPHQVIRLMLTGPGGGERLAALSATTGTTGSTVVAEVAIPAELFCRLLAGRVTPPAGAAVTGDTEAALDLLRVAATMGCD